MENKADYIEIVNGGMCAIDDIKVAGIKNGKYGICIILCENSYVAGTFTSNKVIAAPVAYSKDIIEKGKISLIIANSGNANCFTGNQGFIDIEQIVNHSSNLLKIPKDMIAICSTGVIGRKMPMDIFIPLIDKTYQKLENSDEASLNGAKAIMTTDTVPKQYAIKVKLKNGNFVKIGGISKGTGMISPNMATMLAFIATDGVINNHYLKKALKIAIEDSFNMLVVDGDESTNDTVLFISNGKSNNALVDNDGNIDENFQSALNFLCENLAKQMAKDGEGASKFLEVEIKRAKNKEDAKKAAKAVVKSPLVKTAIFGEDPNWGRIATAIGYSKAELNMETISIAISSKEEIVYLVKNGAILGYDNSKNLKSAEELMKNDEIKIIVDLNQGDSYSTAFGCDFTYDYVKINAEYTT